jgi:hypothetical protein
MEQPKQKLTIQIPSYIHKIETTADKGLKLTIYTQELSSETKKDLFELLDQLGWMVFATSRIEPEDLVHLPPIKKEFKDKKTPSERLRSVLYVYWTQNGAKGDFDEFYKNYVEKIIDNIKEKINP